MPASNPTPAGFGRAADGATQFVGGVAADLYATLMNVAYGNGQAVPPPYLATQTSRDQVQGLSNVLGGTLEGLQEQLQGRDQDGQEQTLAQQHDR